LLVFGGNSHTASVWTPYLHSPRPGLIIRRHRLDAACCAVGGDAVFRGAVAVLLLFLVRDCLLLGLLHDLVDEIQLLFR
jgi:hypothetical protein